MELDKIKRDILKVIERSDLGSTITLGDIEKEICNTETTFQSLQILGILSRIIHRKDEKALRLFIPAVTAWRNYLPQPDLGGLSPIEFTKRYPTGPYESQFLVNMIQEYRGRLDEKVKQESKKSEGKPFDVEEDFAKFQNEYLARVPVVQPFNNTKLMSIREIITEERRLAGHPTHLIDKIGMKFFAENILEALEEKVVAIDDSYITALKELRDMQANPKLRNRKRVAEIRRQLDNDEPYHRCGPAPHQFYYNQAMVVLLDEGEIKTALSLLDKALQLQPDYKLAFAMKEILQGLK